MTASNTEANKAVQRRGLEELWNQGKLDVISEICAPDVVFYDPAGFGFSGHEGARQFVSMVRAAFPDAHFTMEDQIAEGDRVAVRWTSTGMHQGNFMGIPATGVNIITTGITISRFVGGRVVEEWLRWDALGQMQQMGVIAPGRPTLENYMWGTPSNVTGDPGDPEANKAIVVDVIEKLWNQQDLDVLDETRSTDIVIHVPVETVSPWTGIEITKQVVTAYLTGLPDMHVTNNDVFAAGDEVVARWTAKGTHGGELAGIPPTGKPVTYTGITIYRLANGKIVEEWWAWDTLGLIQQIAPPETS
jgi:steroid delta-isomerase-like uncharacterized protein